MRPKAVPSSTAWLGPYQLGDYDKAVPFLEQAFQINFEALGNRRARGRCLLAGWPELEAEFLNRALGLLRSPMITSRPFASSWSRE